MRLRQRHSLGFGVRFRIAGERQPPSAAAHRQPFPVAVKPVVSVSGKLENHKNDWIAPRDFAEVVVILRSQPKAQAVFSDSRRRGSLQLHVYLRLGLFAGYYPSVNANPVWLRTRLIGVSPVDRKRVDIGVRQFGFYVVLTEKATLRSQRLYPPARLTARASQLSTYSARLSTAAARP